RRRFGDGRRARRGRQPLEQTRPRRRRLAVGEEERRQHEDDGGRGGEAREEVASASGAEERLAAAAEDGAHVGALAGLKQDDDDQEEAGQEVNDRDDVVQQRAHPRDSSNLTMRSNPPTSRLAPPTSAPSMSGWAISASMLSGLTLPPYRIRTESATGRPTSCASSPRIA